MVEKPDTFSSERSDDAAGQPSSPIETSISASSRSAVRDPAKKWPTTAAEFDQMFDDGEDIDHLIDWAAARRVDTPNA